MNLKKLLELTVIRLVFAGVAHAQITRVRAKDFLNSIGVGAGIQFSLFSSVNDFCAKPIV